MTSVIVANRFGCMRGLKSRLKIIGFYRIGFERHLIV